ncbi:MAG: malectin domain-containing carbohydrate-binding protein, partial [Deltaproteobacteria bacterium]|nr:malectin domain-containing carbohydrate-binding protein [Deltaproteobacteria bacterium]
YMYAPGSRVFGVLVEGKKVISSLDLFGKAGKYKAYDVMVPVNVTDGLLNIDFRGVVGSPQVNAILIASSAPPVQYKILATAGAGGMISPQGEVSVPEGSTQTFYINPDSGYHIVDVKVDGDSKGATNTLTIADIHENHTVEASFAANQGNRPVVAINCGGPQYIDEAGVIYQADKYFSGGQTYKNVVPIDGTNDDVLYQTERYGNFSYNIPLLNGTYQVVLKFAEIYAYLYGPNSRIFDVKIEGKEVISNLDLFIKAGKYKAYDVTVPVTITDGVLNIEFRTDENAAKVNAILVLGQ